MRRIRVIAYIWLRKFVRLNDTPQSIAAGASIGMFIAMLPIYGFQMIVAAAVAAVARVNKVAAVVPVWITNPLTIPPILYLQYKLGKLAVWGEEDPEIWHKMQRLGKAASEASVLDLKDSSRQVFIAARELGWEVLWPLLVGAIISGLVLGLITYPLMLRAVLWYRRRREARRSRRRDRLAAYLEKKAGEKAANDDGAPEEATPPGP